MEELEESFEAQNGEVTELEESFEAQNGEVTEPEESFEAQNGEVTELEVEDICDQCQSEAHVFCKQCNNSYCTTCSIQKMVSPSPMVCTSSMFLYFMHIHVYCSFRPAFYTSLNNLCYG